MSAYEGLRVSNIGALIIRMFSVLFIISIFSLGGGGVLYYNYKGSPNGIPLELGLERGVCIYSVQSLGFGLVGLLIVACPSYRAYGAYTA